MTKASPSPQSKVLSLHVHLSNMTRLQEGPELSMPFDPVLTRLQTSLKKIIMKADKMYLQGCSVTLFQEKLGCGEICCVLCLVAQLCLTLQLHGL